MKILLGYWFSGRKLDDAILFVGVDDDVSGFGLLYCVINKSITICYYIKDALARIAA